jgi:hypothetical protein
MTVYPDELEVHELKKNEKCNILIEVSIFWDRLEFFVTGDLRGTNTDGAIIPFLGPAIKKMKPDNLQAEVCPRNHLQVFFFYLAEGKFDTLVNIDELDVYNGTLSNYCRNQDVAKQHSFCIFLIHSCFYTIYVKLFYKCVITSLTIC